MIEALHNLLILQDRDRTILRLRTEFANIGPERKSLQTKAEGARAQLEAAKQRAKHIETERKKLELEAEVQKQLIEKYSMQQFQTRRNEEYRALTHEIELCKDTIRKLEDSELELMEEGEEAHQAATSAARAGNDLITVVQKQIADLGEREQNLKKELVELERNREQLAMAVDESARLRYERLTKSKGDNVVVGVEHGVCGGCHMKLPVQVIVTCQGEREIISCPNCGRLLYYTRDMDLATAE